MMNKPILTALLSALPMLAMAEHNETIHLDALSVRAPLIDSRILKHPATVETFDKKQVEETLNAATSSQTLKYMPSMQVRERFIGDRNGNIASRTVGTLASAQNMLFADGVLLSNFLQGNFGSPRWGLVAPEEIESISMMYGPFSALYAGNSFGGVITLITRMPEQFEAHVSAQGFTQNYSLYGTDESFTGNHLTASFGNKVNDLSFWFGVDRLENRSHPMGFSTANLSTTAPGVSPIVTGAYQDKSEVNGDRVIFGANSIDDSEQTNIKFKAAYDITSTVKVAYTLGVWNLDSKTDVQSYVKDAAGNAVYNGRVSFNGQRYDVSAMSPAEADSLHIMQALDVKSNTKGFFDWQLTLSDYDFYEDKNSFSNTPTGGTTAAGNPYLNRVGRVTDQEGTGWTVFDARATLRPQSNYSGTHTLDVGYHIDQYELRSETNNTTDWTTGNKGTLFSAARGNTRTQALYAQDKWQFNPQWALTFGGRAEHWEASEGQNKITIGSVLSTANYKEVSVNKFSPKISLSFEPQPEWGFRASLGQAFRFPTVGELFQPLQNGATPYFVQSNPNLNPEEVISGEFSAERRYDNGLVRASLFSENKYDAPLHNFLRWGVRFHMTLVPALERKAVVIRKMWITFVRVA